MKWQAKTGNITTNLKVKKYFTSTEFITAEIMM